MNKSPATSPCSRVRNAAMSPFSCGTTSVTWSATRRTPRRSVQCRRREAAELGRVQVIGVVRDRGIFGRGELLGALVGVAQVRLRADQVVELRIGMELAPAADEVGLVVAAGQMERMVAGVARAAVGPGDELRALLEGAVALADEVGFASRRCGARYRGWSARCLADADDRHVGRLDDRDLEVVRAGAAVFCGDDAGGQPAGRTTAEDDHVSDGMCRANLWRWGETSESRRSCGPPAPPCLRRSGGQARRGRPAGQNV